MNESASAPENCKRGRIFIVRHAQSTANAGERTADTATVPITDTGICQAQCVADLLSERPSSIVVSLPEDRPNGGAFIATTPRRPGGTVARRRVYLSRSPRL